VGTLHKTPLHAYHVANKASMVPFCGWDMPLQYQNGVFKEHLATRESAGLFDVSHMGQVRFRGADREKFVEWVTCADVQALGEGKARLAVILNDAGGIKDDCMVTRHADHVYVVINAGRRDEDLAHFTQKLTEFKGDVSMEVDTDHGLVALQGPNAAKVLGDIGVAGLEKVNFMETIFTEVKGVKLRVARCGYTGEDGFEVAVPNDSCEDFARTLLANPAVSNVGLGARDSLRLEAGMCLYGNDITEETSVVHAALQWLITKRRNDEGGFIGWEATKKIKANAAELANTRRVGIVSKGLCARQGADVLDADGKKIGTVTSGCPSPTLGGNIAQAYVDVAQIKPGTKVQLQVRARKVPGEIVRLPFVPSKYKK